MSNWRKFVLGCAIGNLLEWYDFILFGFFAHLFSQLFFPHESAFISLLYTFLVFASGCLVRPLASIAFGHFGDTIGRKQALVITIALITVATTCMGLLPTYQQVGVLAPSLLILCRLLQGIAVSGEEMGAAILLAENAPKEQQALVGSIVLSSVYFGLFLGAISVLCVYLLLDQTQLAAWGWRIPFLASGLLGVIAFRMRMQAFESRAFEQLQSQQKVLSLPIRQLVVSHGRVVCRNIALCAILAVAIYLFAVYLPSYHAKYGGFTRQESLMVSAFFLLLAGLVVPFIGYLADKKGCRLFMTIGCWGFLLFSYPIFALLAEHTLFTTMIAEIILVSLLACVAGSLLPLVIHSFPVSVRYSGVCLSFNLSMTIFGSTAPVIALVLQQYLYSEVAPALYLVLAALMSLLALPKKCVTTTASRQRCRAGLTGEC